MSSGRARERLESKATRHVEVHRLRPPAHQPLQAVIEFVVAGPGLEAERRNVVQVLADHPRGDREVPVQSSRGREQLATFGGRQLIVLPAQDAGRRMPLVLGMHRVVGAGAYAPPGPMRPV